MSDPENALRPRRLWLAASTIALASAAVTVADHTPEPAAVTIAGSLQEELGCPGDWQPDCAATHLAYDGDDDHWQGTFTVPAGLTNLRPSGAGKQNLFIHEAWS